MDDRRLYETILGLSAPWRVSGVEVVSEEEEIRVALELTGSSGLCCPECVQSAPRYDRGAERRWRHLDTCQYRTVLVARVPRVECPEHGVRQIRVAWAEDRSRYTALFEAMAIRLLRETTVSGLSRLMDLSWDEAEGILKRAVARGLARREHEPVRFMGIDETSFQKRHEYVTVVSDLERTRVIWVGDDRKKATLARFWAEFPPDLMQYIEEVAMDMWEPYIRTTLEALPDADSKIVIDRYHVAHLLTDAVDRVRRKEQAALRASGDHSLDRTRFLWIKGADRRALSEDLLIEELSEAGLKVGEAWALKEAATRLWEYQHQGWALRFFAKWYAWATESELPPIVRVAETMKRYIRWILHYLRNHLTNAGAEAMNAKIQEVKYRARGYRNRDNFRRAILFYCGGLDLDPR